MRAKIAHLIACSTLAATLASCGHTGSKTASVAGDSTIVRTDSTTAADSIDDDHEILYITIADTGRDYYALMSKMYALSTALRYPVDTMERYYNRKKDEIVLSDSSEDELYRGEYFPRRFTSENLSLEYYYVYSDKTHNKNIALVAGIYESQRAADSLLAVIKPQAANAFVTKARVFVGCMH